jgi:hypothetical protein
MCACGPLRQDPANQYEIVNGRDVPAREHSVTVNYPLEIRRGSTVGHTTHNGATRQIPGTASWDSRNDHPIPSLEVASNSLRLSDAACAAHPLSRFCCRPVGSSGSHAAGLGLLVRRRSRCG